MPGANYMGGRRNAMKARAKDTVGRQQKGHFGRQRLDILSKGISATKPSETGRAGLVVSTLSKSSALDIDLAHARKIPLKDTATTSVRSFVPSPIHITPRTPNSHMRARMRASESHLPSPEVRRSKVLDAVDLSESLFLRRIADQILAMPNLACLPDRNSTKTAASSKVTKKVANKATSIPTRIRKRKVSASDSDEPDPRRKLNISAKPTLREYTIHSSQDPHTPPQKKQQHSMSSNSKTSSRPSLYQQRGSFSRKVSSSSSIFTERERYHHSIEDSGFDSDCDSEGIEAILRSSSLWSADSRQHSSRTSIDDDDFQQNHMLSIMEDDTGANQAMPDSSSATMHENIHQVFVQQASGGTPSRIHLPSAIVLGPGVQQRIGSKDSTSHPTSQTIYGSLFESGDPWKTIGIILGLPERDNKMDSPKYRNVDQEVSASETYQAKLSNPQEGDVVIIDGFEVEKGDTDEDETEGEDDEAVEIDCEWEVQSPTVPIHKRVPDDGLETYNNFSVPELPFRDIAVNIDCASSVHDGEDDTMDVDRGVTEEVEMGIRGAPVNSAEQSTHANTAKASTLVTDFEAPKEVPRPIPIVPDSVGENVMNVDDSDSDHGGSAAGAAGDKILGTPELREVDGRFLGPSLFEDFCESDDE